MQLLLFPFTSLFWIASQIQARVDAELSDRENLEKKLLALQLAFDMGDIEEADFEAQEEALLEQIAAAAAEAEEAS